MKDEVSEAVLLIGAEIDFNAIYGRFALTSVGRADAFDHAVNEALDQIGRFPFSAPTHEDCFRRLMLGGYSLALYYVIEGRRVFVHAILDSRQSPEAIRRRLGL